MLRFGKEKAIPEEMTCRLSFAELHKCENKKNFSEVPRSSPVPNRQMLEQVHTYRLL